MVVRCLGSCFLASGRPTDVGHGILQMVHYPGQSGLLFHGAGEVDVQPWTEAEIREMH